MSQLVYNKVCVIEDFSDPDLLAIMRSVFQHETRSFAPDFPRGVETPRYWEAAMAVRALRDHGALHPDATLLVVGAGVDPTPFYLTAHARQVFAVDRYLAADGRSAIAPRLMLVDPDEVAPYPFEAHRLVVQHMDSRQLRFPDGFFDGIIAFGSTEDKDDLDTLANRAYELGRVLKPNGVLAVCTQHRISGPPGGAGFDDTLLPSLEELGRFVVEASGLDPIDTLDSTISDATIGTRRDLGRYASSNGSEGPLADLSHGLDKPSWSQHPYLIHVHQGYVFSSLHLALRKTESYPAQANAWARPGPEAVAAIRRVNQVALSQTASATHTRQTTAVRERVAMQHNSETINQMRAFFNIWDEARMRGWYNRTLRRLPKPTGAFARGLIRVANLGKVHEAQAQLSRAMLDLHAQTDARLEETGLRIVDLEVRSDEHSSQLVSIEDQRQQQSTIAASIAQLNSRIAQIGELRQEIVQIGAEVAALRSQLGSLGKELEAQTASKARLEGQTDALARGQQELLRSQREAEARTQAQLESQAAAARSVEERLRQAVGSARLLQQQLSQQLAPSSEAASPLTREHLLSIIAEIEREIPALAERSAVEVSIQGEDSEELIVALAEYFTTRASSRGESYRFPNDAWYHIDFSPDWDRADLFAGALARLVTGGHFVLVTRPENTLGADHEGLEPVEDRVLTLEGVPEVRVFVWRKI
jgi:SAM-dependent methyltransferase